MKLVNSAKKSFFCFMVGLLASTGVLSAGLEKIDSINEIETVLKELDSDALVVLDIDEVILTDQDAILRPEGDPLKFKIFNEYFSGAKNQKQMDEIQKILSLPLILAEKKLVEPEIAQVIRSLQKRKIKVIGLTSSPTQSFGEIEDCEKWRLEQVRLFGIHFNRSFPSLTRFLLSEMSFDQIPPPVYNQGILFTEGFSKADVLISFMRKMNVKPSKIVFIDDIYRNVKQMDTKLTLKNIPHKAYHYQRVRNGEPTSLNERIARFQFEYLFKHKKWLNDRQCQDLLNSEDYDLLNLN
jgi:hypothetical protein